MHDDLVPIQVLWRVDDAIDRAKAALSVLEGGQVAAAKKVAALEEELTLHAKTRAELVDAERELNRRAASYVKRRDRAKNMMDLGQVADYHAAQKQLEQCAQILDEIETGILENMEEQERIDGLVSALQSQLLSAKADLASWEERCATEGPKHAAIVKAKGEERPERWAAVPAHQHSQYKDLRRRGHTVLANIEDGICSGCHVKVTAQVRLEVKKNKRVHDCRGCRRWFLHVQNTDSDDETEEA